MKFEIIKGLEFTSKFLIKENNSMLPLELDDADTGVFTITMAGVNPCIIIDKVTMVITDASNGEFTLTLTSDQTKLLEQDIGLREDGYPTLSNYKGIADFNTKEQGQMTAYVQNIYVVDSGVVCQTP